MIVDKQTIIIHVGDFLQGDHGNSDDKGVPEQELLVSTSMLVTLHYISLRQYLIITHLPLHGHHGTCLDTGAWI